MSVDNPTSSVTTSDDIQKSTYQCQSVEAGLDNPAPLPSFDFDDATTLTLGFTDHGSLQFTDGQSRVYSCSSVQEGILCGLYNNSRGENAWVVANSWSSVIAPTRQQLAIPRTMTALILQ